VLLPCSCRRTAPASTLLSRCSASSSSCNSRLTQAND
jgi:hypothetical protein